eukprot:GHUV01017676.1.p1 GENE.GHUV01017676.1~~GHUV01017676.1.p1  ORF type:complete len:211 (-),score=46.58 GHUV01017676.1:521-1153(-)
MPIRSYLPTLTSSSPQFQMAQRNTLTMLLLVGGLMVCTQAFVTPQPASRKLLDTQLVQATKPTEAALGHPSGGSHYGPCIPCKDCTTNNCFSVCQKSCGNPNPPQPIVDGNKCKAYGQAAGTQVAKDACNTAMLYCNGGQKSLTSFFPVTLSQCANIAYGVCQQQATSPWSVSCSPYWSIGYKQCSGSQFWKFYQGEVNDRCNQQVAKIK